MFEIGEKREDFTGKDLNRGHKIYFVFAKRTGIGMFCGEREKEEVYKRRGVDFVRKQRTGDKTDSLCLK